MTTMSNSEPFDAMEPSTNITAGSILAEAFKLAVDKSDRGIGVWEYHAGDRSSELLYANDSMLARLGIVDGDAIANFKAVLANERNAMLRDQIRARVLRGDQSSFEYEIYRTDGASYWAEITCRVLQRNGDTIYFMTIASDLTRRNREKDYMRLLVSSIEEEPDGVFIVEMDPGMSILRPNIVYANNAFLEMHGYDRSDIASGDYPIIIGPETDRELIKQCVMQVFHGEPVVCELKLYRRDGSSYWAEVRAHGLEVPPKHAILIIRDITERRARDEQIGLLSRAIEEASDFVIVTDATPPSSGGPLIVYVNRSFLEATGFSHEDLLGKCSSIIYSASNDPKMMEAIRENMERGLPNYREALIRRKDGSSFWIEFVAKPFVSRYEGLAYRLSIGRDITLRKRAYNQVSLLFGAIESARDRMSLYEPGADGTLSASYENEASALAGRHRLLEMWEHDTPTSMEMREALERGEDVHQIFAEYERDGTPVVVDFTARSIRNMANEVEAVLTVERVLTDAKASSHGIRSRLVNLATTLPSLGQAPTTDERLNILRSILQHTFSVILKEDGELSDDRVHIDAAKRTATFRYGSKSIVGTWTLPLEETSLTALRFVIEAAIEQESLAQASGLF